MELSEARIDESVRRILALKLSRGLFRDPFVDEAVVSDVVGNPAHKATADAIAEPTITLVKNEVGLLPLAAGTGQRVLVTGFGGTTLTSLAGSSTTTGYVRRSSTPVPTPELTPGPRPSPPPARVSWWWRSHLERGPTGASRIW